MRKISCYAAVMIALLTMAVAQSHGQLVSVSESTLNFENVVVGGTPAEDIVTITNVSHLSALPGDPDPGEDIIVGFNVPGSVGFSETYDGFAFLEPGASVDVTVVFEPLAVGYVSDNLVINVTASETDDEVAFVELQGTGVEVEDPCDLVGGIIDFYDQSLEDGTITGTGNYCSNRRARAMRNRLRAIAWLCQKGYYSHAACVTQSAILRSDGAPCPKDFVEGPNVEQLNNELVLLLMLLQ